MAGKKYSERLIDRLEKLQGEVKQLQENIQHIVSEMEILSEDVWECVGFLKNSGGKSNDQKKAV